MNSGWMDERTEGRTDIIISQLLTRGNMYRGQHHKEVVWRNRTEKKEHKTLKKRVVCQSEIQVKITVNSV